MMLYAAMLGLCAAQHADAVRLRQAGLAADDGRLSGPACCKAERLLAIGTFISSCTKNQIVAGVAGFGVCLLLWVLIHWSDFDSSIACQRARTTSRCFRTSIRSPKACWI